MMNPSQSHCFLGITIIYFFFCLLPLRNTLASPTPLLCCRDQREALWELKNEFPNHTDDDIYVTTTSWNKSVDCCSWFGVTCDAGEVISLELVSYAANTSLKSSSGLFKLQHLRYLKLSNCLLQGQIPSSIRNLSRLTFLDLSFNQLVGEVPASIGNLNQLRYMDLSRNDLRGNIPTSFANLTKLSTLELRGNQFTGGDIVLANLTSLSNLYISNNHFKSSISADFSGLHKLEEFFGFDNSFVGSFPSSLLMISSLVRIELGGNQLEGSIDFGNTSLSSKLQVLNVGDNNFSGLIPQSISKLVNLESLDLSHNNFRGRVPTSISTLVNLDSLILSHNNFVGRLPSSISKLANLSSLDLSYNKFEGQVPQCLWRSSKLYSAYLSHNSFSLFDESVEVTDGASIRELDLGSNSFQGQFPQWICKLRDLWAIDLSNNHFSGSIPQCLKNSTYIQELNLRNNSLSGSLPDLFINGSQLRSLDLSNNDLVGKLPKSLINCKYMEILNMKGNKIKDTFPYWLGSLQGFKILVLRSNAFYGPIYNSSAYLGFPSMRIIDISNNNFVGSLPQNYFVNWRAMSLVWNNEDNPESEYMGDDSHMYEDSIDLVYKGVDTDFVRIFQALRAIDFSGNLFSGNIPGSIGLLSELRLLNMSGNAFTGNIPPSLANITKLETLDISRNNFSGEIPRGLGNLSFLSNINFSHNHLQGLVPKSTQFKRQKCSSFVGNPGLYGFEDICKEIHVPVSTSHQPEESLSELEEPVVNWIAAAIAFGPGLFCGLVIGHIFTSYKHKTQVVRSSLSPSLTSS